MNVSIIIAWHTSYPLLQRGPAIAEPPFHTRNQLKTFFYNENFCSFETQDGIKLIKKSFKKIPFTKLILLYLGVIIS